MTICGSCEGGSFPWVRARGRCIEADWSLCCPRPASWPLPVEEAPFSRAPNHWAGQPVNCTVSGAARLVSLVNAGGSGKLALCAASGWRRRFCSNWPACRCWYSAGRLRRAPHIEQVSVHRAAHCRPGTAHLVAFHAMCGLV